MNKQQITRKAIKAIRKNDLKTLSELSSLIDWEDKEITFEMGNWFFSYEEFDKAKGCLESSDLNDPRVQYLLSTIYELERPVYEDAYPRKALDLLRKSAKQNYAPAQYWLGKLYLEGEGVIKSFPTAEKWFRKAAEQKDLDACYELGKILIIKSQKSGEHCITLSGKNLEDGITFLQRAARKKHIQSLMFLHLFFHCLNSKRRKIQAENYLKKALLADPSHAYYWLYDLTARLSGPKHVLLAAEYAFKATENGIWKTRLYPMRDYLNQKYWHEHREGIELPKNKQEIEEQRRHDHYVKMIKSEKSIQNPKTVVDMRLLGKAYFAVIADKDFCDNLRNPVNMVTKTPEMEPLLKPAIKWMSKAAEQDDPQAMYELGRYYESGYHGFERDIKKGQSLLTKAANAGNIDAQIKLGLGHLIALEYPFDSKAGLKWIRKVAIRNDKYADKISHARFVMGMSYAIGIENEKDMKKAVKYWKDACNSPYAHSTSAYFLGYCYAEGLGVKQNNDKALEWYTHAAEWGEPLAKEEIEALKRFSISDGNMKNKQTEK